MTLATVPDTEDASGVLRSGPTSPGTGDDHNEIAKQSRKKVASETAVRKRMLEYTSKLMSFDWAMKEGHEDCQKVVEIRYAGEEEKKRVIKTRAKRATRYRYANCALRHSLVLEKGLIGEERSG